ncbi:Uncharacterized protein TCM_028021 [Theobroma cacao]|uniref:Reverse transcriptase Ty1/copia-type domain-containing protein n=1 Tax=Theobroma cacao TaxID=3641 RepID=A0A061GH80_THECC|nr:Uncharacterized protein TCM_028021 [Theobroma cacao]
MRVVFGWLSGLDSEYDVIHSQVLANKVVSSLFDVVTTVLSTKESVFSTSDVPNRSALVSQGTNEFGNGYRRGSSEGRGNFGGSHGGKGTGGSGGPRVCYNYREKVTSGISTLNPYRDNKIIIINLLHKGNKNNYSSIRSPLNLLMQHHKLAKSQQPSSSFIATLVKSSNPTTCLSSLSRHWVIDSGAIDHMTRNSVSTPSLDTPSSSSRPLITQLYTCRHGTDAAVPQPVDTMSDSLLVPTSMSLDSDLDLLIALRKVSQHGIHDLKVFLQAKFQTKDLGSLKYFLGIKVTRSKKGIFLSQRKYVVELLKDVGLLREKPCETPIDSSVKLIARDREAFADLEKYRRLEVNSCQHLLLFIRML